jgi:hypothetical protein
LSGLAQSTGPTTQPSPDSGAPLKNLSGDQVLDQMLKPSPNPSQPLQPVPDKQVTDKSSGSAALKPGAPKVVLKREGEYLWDRTARITHTATGQTELTFDSDGKALRDPPMIALPNQMLEQMEEQVSSSSRDLKFHVSGMITEYRGRNYILLLRSVVIPDATQQF